MRWAGGGAVVALLLVVTVVRIAVDEPGYGIAFYALIPIVMAAFLFGRVGGLVTAGVASVVYLASELISPSQTVSGTELWLAAVNRSAIYFIAAVTVTVLLKRERGLRSRVEQQQRQLDELRSIREALTPTQIPARPGLEVATSFIPAEGLVAGDFFLVAPGPMNSTTIVVSDVAGHGFEAARRASYVRAVLATYAAYTSDPAQLLQLANTALTERPSPEGMFVTAVCVNITALGGGLRWACAGHPPPVMLDSGEELDGGRRSLPLGLISGDLRLEAGSLTLQTGAGFVLFTDGLTEGRSANRDISMPLAVFGEERVRKVLVANRDSAPRVVSGALSTSVLDFAGEALADDVCIIVCRLSAVSSALTDQEHKREASPRATFPISPSVGVIAPARQPKPPNGIQWAQRMISTRCGSR
ncbi:MAG: PP2C family protein-serine/threonine phosphatase [Pseudonocardiaceae bacterium]